MERYLRISDITVCLKGGGDIATGVAWRLQSSGFRVFITELPQPKAVRRKVAFCEAVYDGHITVEGVEALLVNNPGEIPAVWEKGKIPVLVDPDCNCSREVPPYVIVDAIMAKRNLGTSISDAPLVIALGPGFKAGSDAHFVVETNRGHRLGRLLSSGTAEPNTGIPGSIQGVGKERVLRSPEDGFWESCLEIGDLVKKGDRIGCVGSTTLDAPTSGVVRGLIRPGSEVTRGLKIGDIDPRGIKAFCYTISDKALAIAGGVLEGILRFYSKNL